MEEKDFFKEEWDAKYISYKGFRILLFTDFVKSKNEWLTKSIKHSCSTVYIVDKSSKIVNEIYGQFPFLSEAKAFIDILVHKN